MTRKMKAMFKPSAVLPLQVHNYLIRWELKLGRVKNCLYDDQRKPLTRVIKEFIECSSKNRGFPAYYFDDLLYRKDVRDSASFLSDRELKKILGMMMKDEHLIPFLSNKILFHHYFGKTGIRMPRLLGYNIHDCFISGAKRRYLRDGKDFEILLKDIVKKSRTNAVFMKPVSGSQGESCYKITGDMPAGNGSGSLYNRFLKNDYVFEECLIQHPTVSELYPSSVNTIRILSCMLKDGTRELISAVMRIGTENRVIDNITAGGVYVNVDMSDGQLFPRARMPLKRGGRLLSNHPDTGFEFGNFVIPEFRAVKKMVLKAARHLPYKVIGWDVAITSKGPVIIEGNYSPHISMMEMAAGGGFRHHPVFSRFLKDYEIIR